MPLLNSLLRQAHRPKFTPRLTASLTTTLRRPHGHHLLRHASSTPTSSTAAQQARKRAQLYPRCINIFRAGTPATLSVGITRISTLVIFIIGSGLYAPAFYFSPDHPNWYVPAFILASAIPAIVVALATGPMIHGIRVTLPDRVRRGGKDGLQRWSSVNTPGDTQLELQFMRWKPWPRPTPVKLGELRRLRPTLTGGIANLEWRPKHMEEHDKKHPISGWLANRAMGKFYVKRDQKVDRAAVPGVWDGIWRQIPFKGEDRHASEESKVKREPTPLRRVVPPQAPTGRP